MVTVARDIALAELRHSITAQSMYVELISWNLS